jgi:hypothetical protein
MTFTPTNLTALAYGNGFTMWHYTTGDLFDAVNQPGYFNEASEVLKERDVIVVVSGRTAPETHLVTVLSNEDGTVRMNDGTPVEETSQ